MTIEPRQGSAFSAQWAECERELYSAALSVPDRYQLSIFATQRLLSDLRKSGSIESTDSMERHWLDLDHFITAQPLFRSAATRDLAPRLLVGAVFALRDRELRSQAAGLARIQAIETAKTSDQAWAHIEDAPAPNEWLYAGRQWIEVHCASLRALICTIENSPVQLTVSHAVVDSSSGALLALQNPMADIRVVDASLFDSTLANERRSIEQP